MNYKIGDKFYYKDKLFIIIGMNESGSSKYICEDEIYGRTYWNANDRRSSLPETYPQSCQHSLEAACIR